MMKKFFYFLMVAFAAMQMNAANVDPVTAQNKAKAFVQGLQQSGSLMSPVSTNLVLLHAEPSDVKVNAPVYYIFDAGNGFVIVSGDDRAEEILAYGDSRLDMSNLPCNMEAWLKLYKKQIEYLQEHPGLVVEKTTSSTSLRATAVVGPLLTSKWDQSSPYYNQCPTYSGSRCLTGCPATSLAQVFYYWKYPTAATPAVPAYQYMRDGASTYTTVSGLPSTTFNWMNMRDTYRTGYTSAQATAVATLMRYVGQAEHMCYDTDGSGISSDSTVLIANACKFFGYDNNVRTVKKTNTWGGTIYSDDQWKTLINTELDAGRPIVYCAVDDYNRGGHAFNLDGYDSSGKYHINWGWSGSGDGYFALNSFNSGYNYNTYQQMVIGIEPPYQGPTPVLTVNPESITFRTEVGDTATQTFTVTGTNLRSDVSLSISGSSMYSVSPTTLTKAEATSGATVTVSYCPRGLSTSTATVTLSTLSGEDVTVPITGTGVHIPVLNVNPSSLDFSAEVDERESKTFVVKGVNLTETLILKVIDDPEDFYIDKTAILKSGANSENGVTVTATYYPADYGTHQARVEITGGGLDEPVYVYLTGTASIPKYVPVMQPASAAYITLNSFRAEWTDENPDYSLASYTLWLHPSGGTAVTYPGLGPDKFYTFENLINGGTYTYKVKAVYVDGTESAWSNTESVTLYANAHPYDVGDVDHDGTIGIADVSALIDYILDRTTPICLVCADVNADGAVDIADVSDLIDILLSK